MTEAKLFVGEPEKVEKAFNRWSAEDGVVRQIVSILPFAMPAGEVGFMVMFQLVSQINQSPKRIVPVGALPN